MRKRRAIMILVVGALLLTTVAGTALAKTFTCAPGSTKENPCKGTKKADKIYAPPTVSDDYIIARAGKDVVYANPGNDVVFGGGGADYISGHNGNDTLYGGGGDDRIVDDNGPLTGGAPDFDIVYGGPGVDTINVQDGDDLDWICTGGGNDPVPLTDTNDHVDAPNFCG